MNNKVRTSLSHPLQIAEVTAPDNGIIGITFCPGKKQPNAMTGAWDRDLEIDFKTIKDWGAKLIVTLVTDDEMKSLGVKNIRAVAMENGIDWVHMPINDYSIPDEKWNFHWHGPWGRRIHKHLDNDDKILIHCKGGLGRAGTISAKILVERGVNRKQAIEMVRNVRPGAIETMEQENFVLDTSLEHYPPSMDRAWGSMLGLMIGDALGTTLEFSQRDANPLHTEITGGGPFKLPRGAYTDDTAMAFALADSLFEKDEIDEKTLMDKFVSWWREGTYSSGLGCFDIGITTRQALSKYEKTGNPIAGDTNPSAAGNGSLMRLSPIAVKWRKDIVKAMIMARRQSATTHAAPECLDACAYFASLLVRAINGEGKEEILSPTHWDGEGKIAAIARGLWRGKARDEIKSTGYVIDTLEAAIWCVANSENFEQALILAVNLGGDADTIGAVTGQLAGAIWGARNIPERWVNALMVPPTKFQIMFESLFK